MSDLQTVAVSSCVSLALLWFFVVTSYRYYRIDTIRYQLFRLRAEMFDYAADGHISFTDPAYELSREHINCLIQFAHRLTSIRALIMIASPLKVPKRGPVRQLMEAIDGVHETEVRLRMRDFNGRMRGIVRTHLITSPLLLIGMPLALLFLFAMGQLRHLKSTQEEIGNKIENQAVGFVASRQFVPAYGY